MLRAIHHVAIIASDYERSRAFYRDGLGLAVIREIWRAERRSWKCDLALGDAQIELFSFPDPPPRPSRPEARGLRHLAFAVSDLDATIARLVDQGVTCEPVRIDEFTGARFTFFEDPDGLPLELYEDRSQTPASPCPEHHEFDPDVTSLTQIGIDFGTSNSVVSLATPEGQTRTLSLPGGHDACRTVLCLWQEMARGKLTLHDAIGDEAVEAYLDDPAESRLILSMKSYLAQASFRETRLLGHRLTLEALVAIFLRRLMTGLGLDPARARATVGRPVRFAGDRADDAFGADRLTASLREAGFAEARLAYEPEAAGLRFARRLEAPATVLVGDFGGGTSDFSVLRFDPATGAVPLGHAGVGIAGDQLDYRILTQVVAPHLGMNETYRVMGGAPLPVPVAWYADLGRWHRLSLMRNPQTLRAIADVARTATNPEKLRRLIALIEAQQAHALHGAIGRTKAALSRETSARFHFRHQDLEIDEIVERVDFERWIAPDLARFDAAIDEALATAGRGTGAIDRVFLTGGTSFVPAVRALFERRFGPERIDTGGEFVSVAEGLALLGAQRG